MTHPAYEIIGVDRPARFLISCDHASNHVPADVNGGTLGLPTADMNRHIAYDIGAAGVTRHLAQLLNAPAILSRFSRLVIDPNRGADDPTLMMRLYDGSIIPGNHHADAREIARRKAAYYDPYHTAYTNLAAQRDDTIIIAIHSFTRRLNSGAPRPWQIGVLFADDTRLSDPLIARLQGEPGLNVGINQPYMGHLPGDAVDRHALQHGRLNALIELRNDLIATDEQQNAWAARLAPILQDALNTTKL
ncbi:MAG: N-formylglutamate amidohydrolase [Paracoccaceae bacterium]